MRGSLVADLGVGPEIWLFLALLGCLTLFFKFGRVWSVRNLDLLLLFAPAPGMMMLVGNGAHQPWIAFVWLFVGSMLWLVRCLLDLGLSRRPLLEPNLNAAGLACLSIGVLGLLVAETVSLPVVEGAARNPANPGGRDAARRWPARRQRDGPPGDRDRPAAQRAEEVEAAGDPVAGPGEPGAPGAGGGPDRRRLAALREADRRAVGGDLLPDLALHPDRFGRQRPGRPGRVDRGGAGLLRAADGRRRPDRAVGGLDAGVPGAGGAVGGLLPRPGRHAVRRDGGRRRRRLRRAGLGRPRPGRLGPALGARSLAEAGLVPSVEPPRSAASGRASTRAIASRS